jgi:integration host factor subunit beta
LSVRQLGARRGRNPRTGDGVNVAERHYATFRLGRPMHRRLNG